MSQQTNLNVAPYFDDYDPASDYHKVLFKPGYPVQARELTTLQSILQNQIERFGRHLFKEGAKVIPGNTLYNSKYPCIQLNTTYQGVPVAAYADQLVGTKITGQSSGISAFVDKILLPQDSERGVLTLYINYLNSSTTNNSSETFFDGELLTCSATLTSGLLGNTSITSGSPFAITIENNAAAIGCAYSIQDGVYFVRGNFVNVQKETLILDQYSNTPNYRVGLYVQEDIVNANIDETLNDNSQGFNNYSAPGADRLKISLRLFKKSLDDNNDNNFVELASLRNGKISSVYERGDLGGGPGYNEVIDLLASRTYAESGDYFVKPFDINLVDSLNDDVGNRGLFQTGQLTYNGSVPSDDLAVYQISSGRAFIRGYDCNVPNQTFLDVDKPRTTKTLKDQSIIYNTGPTLKLNRVYGSPILGIGNTYALSLRDQRRASGIATVGKEIGVARVYDCRLESGSYSASNANTNQWNISLYDVQTFTDLTLNSAVDLSVPTYVKGANSGATGFIRYDVSSGVAVTVYNTTGEFIPNESLIFDGIGNGRIAIAVTTYSISDVKSVHGTNDGIVGVGSTFLGDVIQSIGYNVGIATISAAGGGISTVRSSNQDFPGTIVRKNNLVQYTNPASPNINYAKVVSVGATSIVIEAVTNVTGVVSGDLPTSQLNVTDFKILATKLERSTDNTLYTRLPKVNIASVDLTNAQLTIRKTFTVNISGNQLSSPVNAGTNETFLGFDEERYSLIRSDGTTEELTADKFAFLLGGSQLQIYNLGSNDTGATLTATLRKIKPKAKEKIKNRVNSITITKSKYSASGIGSTTLNDGLSYGNYPFGTRVQDEILSLNVPDIIEIHGIFESTSASDNATAPRVVLSSIISESTTTSELIVGELIKGQTSGAVAIVAEKLTDSQISFVYKNQGGYRFKEGETLTFAESNVTATALTIDSPSFDISHNYTFKTGQQDTYYGYGSLIRNEQSQEPSKKLKVYFSNGYFDATDDGDITTVESYKQFNYSKDILSVGNVSPKDTIDIRPRVSQFNVQENARSPLEFYGRTFNPSLGSAKNILASDETILTTFSYYQGRIDRIFLTREGVFQVKYGQPSDKPEMPVSVDEALEIATITFPPYLYRTEQASIKYLEHKRYRMVDIKQLETRIRNLEYYTTLSLLETNTANLFIPDADGFNRFKSGFLVDNFSSFISQETNYGIKNSIDLTNKELRPAHYTNSIDLIFGPVSNTSPTEFSPIEGVNIRKSNDVITLDYAEVEWLKHSYGTRLESVTPFLVNFWEGTLELTPESDTWVDTTRLEARIIETEGNYAQTVNDLARTDNLDPQTGFAPVVWGAWVANWTGATQIVRSTTQTNEWRGGDGWAEQITRLNTFEETREAGSESRTGTQIVVTEQFDRTSVGDRVVSRELIPFMRSRNIEFFARKVKPLTRVYPFFNGVDMSRFCVPKLLEVSMVSGTFQVGETVSGTVITTGLNPQLFDRVPRISFRLAQANHREGPYDSPTRIYRLNPYDSANQPLPSTYSSTSTILNVDTYSLAAQVLGQFSGYIDIGMSLVGQTSGARATITNNRLISDLSAVVAGSLFVPNPNCVNHPRFAVGDIPFRLISDSNNNVDLSTTIAERNFSASGTHETVQENIISVRNANVQVQTARQDRGITRSLGTRLASSEIISRNFWTWDVGGGGGDPLAQTFFINETTGIFVTKCDFFFGTKDDMDIPLMFSIRPVVNGFPTQEMLPFSVIVVDPDQINTSSDGSVATTIEFDAPVYLESGREYALILDSQSTKYNVFISRVGENDLITDEFVAQQPYLGSLLKSQNGSTWEPSQWDDLKFTLYRADFVESGSVELYNPQLREGNGQIPTLLPDALTPNSRRIRVGLGTTLADSGYVLGNTFSQLGTYGTGNLVGVAGSATGSLTVSNAGIGYTPSISGYTFPGVNLVTLTGNGRGATAEVSISNGVAIAATITNGGSGYQIGDVLGITTIGIASIGRDARFTVVSIGTTSELILDNVQGNFLTGAGYTMMYTNSSGIVTTLNYSRGGNVTPTSIVVENDGLHIKVNHKNHGMYAPENFVEIKGVLSDIVPTRLTAQYDATSTGPIAIQDPTNFGTFENVGVGTTNTGYVLIENEIIEYTSVSGSNLGGNIVRGINPRTYPVGTPVYKYELGGVNLSRINKVHSLSDATVSNPITFDSYHLKLDMEALNVNNDDRSDDVGYPALYLNQTKSAGGYNIRASQNMPFEIITPMVQNVTVSGTNLSGEIKTTTGKSMSGNEIPFVDNGFEPITINEPNYLDTPRIIASDINESNRLLGNKSLNMRLLLNTTDSRITPIIDAQRINVITTSNRVNDIIENYATDRRVNGFTSDPTACQYISKEILLENSASSIKILVAAHVNVNSDIRAFYAIGNEPGFNPIFAPFPGYSNLDVRNRIIAAENNNGEPDVFVSKTNSYGFGNDVEFKEYTFSIDQLPPFRTYRVKLILTSTSQVYVPRLKDLRVIALA
jgi:hypothetical protein